MKSAVLLLLVACGSSSSKTPDARPIDAPPDMPVDVAGPVNGHAHYVVDQMTWPANSSQARADAFDVNGDGTPDNELGAAIATLRSQGLDSQPGTDKAIATGAIIMLGDLAATDLTTDASATFTLYQGNNPNPPPCNGSADTVCGRHLQGTGSFTVDPTAPRDTPLPGAIATGMYTGGPGHLTIAATFFGGPAVTLTLLGAHAHLAVSATAVTQGTIGGAIPETDVQAKILPSMQGGATAQIATDCSNLASPPQCGCTSGSEGATLIGLFDTNQDCMVSVTEIQNNALIQSLFASDVTVENMNCLSVGFAVTAVAATFTP